MSWYDYLRQCRDREHPDHVGHDLCGWPSESSVVNWVECNCNGACDTLRLELPLLSKEDWERKELAKEIALAISQRFDWRTR